MHQLRSAKDTANDSRRADGMANAGLEAASVWQGVGETSYATIFSFQLPEHPAVVSGRPVRAFFRRRAGLSIGASF